MPHQAGLPQLDVHTFSSQIFWLVVSFLLLFAVVRGLAHPRLTRVAGERTARTGGDISAAEAARAAAHEREAALAKAIADAHDRARADLAAATDAARAKSGAALADLGHRLAAKSAEAEQLLAARRAEAQGELAVTARDLAGDLVHRMTGMAPAPARLDAALGGVGA